MKEFKARLDILAAAQLRLWSELSVVPEEFVLYGGTAVALHLGHRTSVDFDFFSRRPLDVESLQADIPFLAEAKIVQREKNTLSAIVDRGEPVIGARGSAIPTTSMSYEVHPSHLAYIGNRAPNHLVRASGAVALRTNPLHGVRDDLRASRGYESHTPARLRRRYSRSSRSSSPGNY